AEQGVSSYQLRVEGEGNDPVPENNRARLLVGVRGARPVLCVDTSGASGLPPLLAEGGLDIQTATPSQCDWTLEGLAGYAAVVLENTPASAIGHVGMENLAAWVSQSGGGLMFTGGKDSYGPGGYFKSPLDPIMPVSMELRREHRKLSLAVVVALDRSGSMAMTVPGGRAKMDLANLATAEVVDMLGPLDQFGCLAVDSTPHEIVALRDVTDRNAIRREVLRIDSGGGGIFVHEALSAATRMIASATAGTRHIILFADAADSERPGNYKKLVEDCVKAGITISVVGLGSETDRDAPLLKDIARRAGGQCMFTNIAQELPRLFAQDMFLVARSAFLEDPVGVRPTGGLMTITRQPFGDFPNIGGYNLCYPRPNANLALVSVDEYEAPVLATWQAGLGRVSCYAGEADGEYTGPIASWDQTGDFFTSLARWTAGEAQGLGDGVVATQELRNGVCRIELHLDPARETPPFSRLPELSLLAARPGETAATSNAPMRWSSADTLVGEIPLSGSETLLATISAPELGNATLAPVCLPYSPEYLPRKPGRGEAALEQLASSTAGRARLNLADIWNAIPWKPRLIPLSSYLLLAAVAIFLLEIIQRRTRVLSVRWLRTSVPRPIQAARRRAASTLQRRTRRRVEPRPGEPDSPAAEPPASAGHETPAEGDRREEAGDDSMLDALSHARQRAQNRTGRH
ncbi:MAG: VWA domain-containing protein, partial [Pirellulaceae bacterium]